ncbi:MAG: hypothetical protein GW906_10990 [Epsilonproteobacteria bacterium]|nr:hypothetical protein [Campylobacterota bacterium]OIO17565.1 MAG: hypothetical protein AUJ81_01585 [Helicobacteraceae bacterium CG1_02_36_14]PIP10953.1 MAG: hypothetical protein COX50_03130 [Sulfurimonas sp. CG23_combo_of_CG06-09_8_20_14_all_36_33]PIS25696.1 MAG: hypothetical protein COT46_05160 [Sulfurimonas sp. CG08_land_8_20_14_0_20_36_33]PIU34802.1 MAG: hypothetical protein COT05_06100 [Sulfurimonas sp. CG07_land_8_20_14_0_80_36_56]PIV05653.1 MAG: hypothetical protein COS56_00565 [Sulfur
MSEKFKVDIEHLQKVHRTIRKAGNIFPNESTLVATLEEEIIKAQDDNSLNTYYSMAQYLKQRIKELRSHLETPQQGVEEAYTDLTWSINYLQWLVAEKKN